MNPELTQRTIAIVTPYFPPYGGGLERYAFEIASRLNSQHGYRTIVITSGNRFGVDLKEKIGGLTIYRLSYNLKISNTPFSFSWFGKIKSILKNENPELINIHMPVPGIGDVVSLLSNKIPIVVSYHSASMRKEQSIWNIFTWFYEHLFLPRLLRRANHIVCSSNFVRFNFLGKYIYKSTTITPAVDRDLFKPAPDRKTGYPNVLFVAGLGRAEQHKGLQTLIEAIKELHTNVANVHLTIVGDGDMRSEYEQRVQRLGLEKNTTFTGRLSGEKLAEQYQKAHVFALPSTNESFSMVILEAMSCSLPVVATNIGGITALVSDQTTGFLITPQDGATLAKKLEQLLLDPELSNSMGNAGRIKIEGNFGWETRTKSYDQIFNRLLENVSENNKVAIVIPYFYPKIGGLENYALDMARALKNQGKDVFIITSNHIDNGWRYGEVEGMRIYRMPILFSISNTPINPLWRFWIKDILKKEKPIVINAHTPVPYISDVAERVRGKIPFVLNYQNDLVKSSYFLNLLCKLEYFFLTNKTLRRANRIIVTSEYYARQSPYLRPVYNKIDVVPPGIDMDHFKLGLQTQYFDSRFKDFRNILFVGQLDRTHRHKGLDDLLIAVSKLKNTIPNIKLIVVGKGNDINSYRNKAKSLGITNEVSFEGFVDNNLLPQYYTSADVLVLPSRDRAEGFGMVITEAAACGTPAIATTIGGIPAALIDGSTGLLVSPSNINQLTEAIRKILSDDSLAKTLGEQANRRIEQEFSLPIVSQKFLRIINSTI